MSAAESISYSPLTLTSGAVAMAVENSITGPGVAAADRVGAPKSVVVASAAPKFNVAGKFQGQELGEILRTLTEMAQVVNNPAARDAIDPDVFAQSLKEQVKGLEKLGFEGTQPILDLLDEPSDTGTQESFEGTSLAESKANLIQMAMAMTGMQSALAEVQLSQMKESSVMSNKTLGMIEAQRDLANQNIDDQMAAQAKQKRLHRWMMIGTLVAMTLMVAAGQPEMAVMMGAMLALQKSGAMEAATSGIDNPALKKLTEAAILVAVTVVTGGVAAGLEGGLTMLSEVGANTMAEMGVEAASSTLSEEVTSSIAKKVVSVVDDAISAIIKAATQLGYGLSTVAEVGVEEAVANLSEDAVKLSYDNAASVAKNIAIMGSGQVLLSSGAVTQLSDWLTELFYLGQEDKNKAKEIVKMVTELVFTVAVSAALMYAASSQGKITGEKMLTLGKVLMGASFGTQLATDGLTMYSGAEMFDIAKLQKQNAGYQAGLQQAQFMNKYNLDAMQTNQEIGRQMMKSLQTTMLEVFANLSAPTKAAAQVVGRA